MSSEVSYSIERSQKDEENSRSDVPILPLGESGGPEATGTRERPAARRAKRLKLALSRAFPRTYRVTSRALFYLRGPRPKRDLDRESCLVTPTSIVDLIHIPFANCGDLQHRFPSCI